MAHNVELVCSLHEEEGGQFFLQSFLYILASHTHTTAPVGRVCVCVCVLNGQFVSLYTT